jgi:hypothetical protein
LLARWRAEARDRRPGIVYLVILVKNGARILGPAGLIVGLLARSCALVVWSVFIVLMSGALWYSDHKTGWISTPRHQAGPE